MPWRPMAALVTGAFTVGKASSTMINHTLVWGIPYLRGTTSGAFHSQTTQLLSYPQDTIPNQRLPGSLLSAWLQWKPALTRGLFLMLKNQTVPLYKSSFTTLFSSCLLKIDHQPPHTQKLSFTKGIVGSSGGRAFDSGSRGYRLKSLPYVVEDISDC